MGEVLDWIAWFEARYSRFIPDSLISRINAAAGEHWVEVDPETGQVPNLPMQAVIESAAVSTVKGLSPLALPPLPSGVAVSCCSAACAERTNPAGDNKGNVILATTNGGASWKKQTSGVTHGLNAVAFANDTHGWAAAASGPILATTNGGTTWKAQKALVPDAWNALYGITFVDASHGWAVGRGGAIVATTNGGATWTRQASGTWMNIYSVAFSDLDHGWAASDGGATLVTSNGGATWGTLNGDSSAGLQGVACIDATHAWAVGYGGAIMTTDPGSDLTPPLLSASGIANNTWTNHALTLSLTASDPAGGSGLNGIYTSVDGVDPTLVPGATATIPVAAPSTHANDGNRYLDFWSADLIGNTSGITEIHVVVDTRAPVPLAPKAASALRGRKATLKYEVKDAAITGNYAKTVTIVVKSPKGKVVKTIRLTKRAVNRLLLTTFVVPKHWARGTYRFLVYATDRTGNLQAKVAYNKLVVK